MASAGKRWPPVPPPAMIILFLMLCEHHSCLAWTTADCSSGHRDVQKNPHREEVHYKTAPAETDEWDRQTGRGDKTGDHCGVNKGVENDLG